MIEKTSHSILLVSTAEKGIDAITKILRQNEYQNITTVRTSGEARRLLSVQNFDMILINTPLSDEFGIELAMQLAENTCSGVMLIVRADISEIVAGKTEDFGIITTAKPIDRTLFHHSIRLLFAMHVKFQKLENENKRLQQKLDEVKLVQRAKRMLMECLKMSESQAHHYIERQAMDMRITKYEVANSIIRTYTDSY